MALWECAECTTKYAVGMPQCPHCGSTVRVNEATRPPEEDDDMAKVTVHGGPSNALTGLADGEHVLSAEAVAAATEGGEDVSAGNNSSTSPEKPSSSPAPKETPPPSRVRTTGSRSKKGQTDSPSAPSTGGGQADGTSATDSAADKS
jgi:hypothetical protein